MKTISQGLIIIAIFFSVWLGFSQINWLNLFHLADAGQTTEEKLGELFWEHISEEEKEIKNKKITKTIDSLLSKICIANKIQRSSIKLHIVENDEINAFALPNKHLVINTGLILAAENESELSGVICHELAHIQKNHVMKKLITEMGLNALISITAGQKGGEIMSKTAKLLSSAAYSRNIEKEADMTAVEYLIDADINPEGLANFLYKMTNSNDSSDENYLQWISTHPESKERGEYIVEYCKDKPSKDIQILSKRTWDKLQKNLKKLISEDSEEEIEESEN